MLSQQRFNMWDVFHPVLTRRQKSDCLLSHDIQPRVYIRNVLALEEDEVMPSGRTGKQISWFVAESFFGFSCCVSDCSRFSLTVSWLLEQKLVSEADRFNLSISWDQCCSLLCEYHHTQTFHIWSLFTPSKLYSFTTKLLIQRKHLSLIDFPLAHVHPPLPLQHIIIFVILVIITIILQHFP